MNLLSYVRMEYMKPHYTRTHHTNKVHAVKKVTGIFPPGHGPILFPAWNHAFPDFQILRDPSAIGSMLGKVAAPPPGGPCSMCNSPPMLYLVYTTCFVCTFRCIVFSEWNNGIRSASGPEDWRLCRKNRAQTTPSVTECHAE